MRTWIVIALVYGTACREPRPTTIANKRPARVVRVEACPASFRFGSSVHLWNRELFPGCSPAPFGLTEGVICDGACPMPCRSRETVARVQYVSTYRYERGRLLGSSMVGEGSENPPVREECTYREGVLVSCVDLNGVSITPRRDARGAISEIVFGDGRRLVVTRDANGDITEIDDAAFRHQRVRFVRDAARRVIEEIETSTAGGGTGQGADTVTIRYRYDDAGRYLGSRDRQLELEYDDHTGLVARTKQAINDGFDTTTFTYDDNQRPTRIVVTRSNPSYDEDPETVTDYEYECGEGAPH